MTRRSVCDLAIDAHGITVFREMTVEDQFVALLAGVLTGLVGVCFASVDDAGRDGVMKALNDYLPMAREQASAIIDGNTPTNPTAGAS